MVESWRETLGEPDLDVFVVQLPEFDPGNRAGRYAFGHIRIGQFLAAEADLRSTLVPALGLGTRDDIHPPDKVALASRIADAFLLEDAAPGDCKHIELHAWSETGPIEICDTGFGDCRDVSADFAGASNPIELLSSMDLLEGERFVMGRGNIPSNWYTCGGGAVSAQGPRALTAQAR